MSIQGDVSGGQNSVIDTSEAGAGIEIKNMSVKNNLIDGESTGKYAIYGYNITGTWTISDNEIKILIAGMLLTIQVAHSNQLLAVWIPLYLVGNTLTNVKGSIAFEERLR